MRPRDLLALAIVAGCVPALPPPAHWGSMPATALRDQPTVSVTGSCCFVANVDAALPLGDAGAFDVGGQVGPNTAGGGIGLWLRSPPDPEGPKGVTHGGGRLGLNAGTGDMFGVLRYDMPYVGVSLHGQIAIPYEHGHALSVTAGVEVQRPVDLDIEDTTVTLDGERVTIVPSPDLWLDLDVNGEIAVADPLAIVLGGSLRCMVGPVLLPLPNFTLGLKF